MADFVLSSCITRCPIELIVEALKSCLTDGRVAFLSSDLSLLSMTCWPLRPLSRSGVHSHASLPLPVDATLRVHLRVPAGPSLCPPVAHALPRGPSTRLPLERVHRAGLSFRPHHRRRQSIGLLSACFSHADSVSREHVQALLPLDVSPSSSPSLEGNRADADDSPKLAGRRILPSPTMQKLKELYDRNVAKWKQVKCSSASVFVAHLTRSRSLLDACVPVSSTSLLPEYNICDLRRFPLPLRPQ